ncbi:MAG: hypothetical protein U9Q66_02850 [Patescibacteria group bacterium]|nr:hypothetical protein [Patescibacteria group bacterium]
MKKIYKSLAALAAVFMLAGCEYSNPTMGTVEVVKKGAAMGKEGGGVIEQTFFGSQKNQVSGFSSSAQITADLYTPQAVVADLQINMEKDRNTLVTYKFILSFSLAIEPAYMTISEFPAYANQIDRILEEVAQNIIMGKSQGLTIVTVKDKNSKKSHTGFSKSDFDDRVAISNEILNAFKLKFAKSFPKYSNNFHWHYLTLDSMAFDKDAIKPLERIAISEQKKQEAELKRDVKDLEGQLKVVHSENEALALKVEADSVTDEVIAYKSWKVVNGSWKNKNIKKKVILRLNPDLSIKLTK